MKAVMQDAMSSLGTKPNATNNSGLNWATLKLTDVYASFQPSGVVHGQNLYDCNRCVGDFRIEVVAFSHDPIAIGRPLAWIRHR